MKTALSEGSAGRSLSRTSAMAQSCRFCDVCFRYPRCQTLGTGLLVVLRLNCNSPRSQRGIRMIAAAVKLGMFCRALA